MVQCGFYIVSVSTHTHTRTFCFLKKHWGILRSLSKQKEFGFFGFSHVPLFVQLQVGFLIIRTDLHQLTLQQLKGLWKQQEYFVISQQLWAHLRDIFISVTDECI